MSCQWLVKNSHTPPPRIIVGGDVLSVIGEELTPPPPSLLRGDVLSATGEEHLPLRQARGGTPPSTPPHLLPVPGRALGCGAEALVACLTRAVCV